MVGVRLPSTRDQKVHIEQMTHASSSRSALTVSVVIGGTPGAETRTGRPNLPRVSLAPRGDLRSRTNLCPSSVISTLSPGRRFRALRNRVGMTSCPLVESVDVLIPMSYSDLPAGTEEDSTTAPPPVKKRPLLYAGGTTLNSVIITDYGVALGKTGDRLVVRGPRPKLELIEGGPQLFLPLGLSAQKARAYDRLLQRRKVSAAAVAQGKARRRQAA